MKFMHKMMLLGIAVVISIACVNLCARDANAAPLILTEDGLQKVLQNTGDKIVVLNFFATWCPPCRAEIPDLIRLRKHFSADQVEFIGVSLDGTDAALERFMAKTHFNYPIYRDDGSIARALQLSSIPHNVVVDGTGQLLYNQPGQIDESMLSEIINNALQNRKK